MSFQNKDFWMPKGAGCFTEGEMAYDRSSRLQPKRLHQWFLDPTETELFPSKKPALETSNDIPIPGVPNVNLPWENPSSFHSVVNQVNDRLFGSELPRTINFGGRNIHSVNAGHLDLGRRGVEDHFGNDASVALSMSHTLEDPESFLPYGGIRKVKVNQVKDSDNGMSHMDNPYNSIDQHTISLSGFQQDPEMNPLPSKLNHGKDFHNDMSIQMGNTFIRGNNNTIPFSCFQEQPGSRLSELKHCGNDYNFQTFLRCDGNTIFFNAFEVEPGMNSLSGRVNQVKDSENVTSFMGSTFSKVDANTISFAGLPVEPEMDLPSCRLIGNYDSLTHRSLVQPSETSKDKELVESNSDLVVTATPLAASTTATSEPSKIKEPKVSKKLLPNNFPSNVRSLLSTGILDGVHVKYISWSREKELGGMIKGSGYLCGCQSCQYSKALNAYEFERHAGCKTKHPNNHIFFENGKTIYGIVQELRSTPQNMLFEAIRTITGSPINEKAFRVWKASYEAATRELQRIYGKDEINLT